MPAAIRSRVGESTRTPGSFARGSRAGGMVLVVMAMVGCQGLWPAHDYLELDEDAPTWRATETRRFSDVTEQRLLAASGTALQDLGFTVRRTHAEVGLVMASKRGSAVNPVQVVGYIAIGLMAGQGPPAWDEEQEVRASLLIMPERTGGEDGFRVRLTLQREVFNTDGNTTRMEPIHDPDIFQRFFDLLGTSLFYEQQQL